MNLLVTLLTIKRVDDGSYAALANRNETIVVYFTPLCAACATVEKDAAEIAQLNLTVLLLDCSTSRRACRAFRNRTAPGAAYVQNGVQRHFDGTFGTAAIKNWVLGERQEIQVFTRDEAYDYIVEKALDIYVIVDIAEKDFANHFERWREDPSVLFCEGATNKVTAYRQGIDITMDLGDISNIPRFVTENKQPLLKNSNYQSPTDPVRNVVLFTSDEEIVEEVLVYVRKLHIDNDILLDSFDFFLSSYADTLRQITPQDFPFVLVLQQDTMYYMQDFKSAYHLNRFLYDIESGREDAIAYDPENYISTENNINIQYISSDERNRDDQDDDDDYDYE